MGSGDYRDPLYVSAILALELVASTVCLLKKVRASKWQEAVLALKRFANMKDVGSANEALMADRMLPSLMTERSAWIGTWT